MKNVPIKFRGRFWLKGLDPSDIKSSLDDGDFVYGGYARMKFLFEDDEGDFIINNNGTVFLVYPGSVAQLCGYDADGNEVYEGDTFELIKIEYTTYTIKAKLEANVNLSMFRKVDDNV